MNEEIKEILDDYSCIPRIKKLGDYITNLQEELKYSVPQVKHNQIVSKLSKEKHILQEENQKLVKVIDEAKELINYYGITPEQNDNVILRYILSDLLKILNKLTELKERK